MRVVGYGVLYVALVAMSVAMFFLGEPVLGIVGVAFFGGGGAVPLLFALAARRSARPPTSARHGSLPGMRRFTAEPAGVVFPGSRWGMVVTLAGSMVFVAVGVLLLYVGSTAQTLLGRVGFPLVGLLAIVVFGLFGALGLRAFVMGGHGIALVADGVYFRAPAGRAWVRWDDLHSVRLGDGIQFLAHSPETISLTGINRLAHRLNHSRFGMDVGYPVQGLQADPGAVVALINHYRACPESRLSLRDPASAG